MRLLPLAPCSIKLDDVLKDGEDNEEPLLLLAGGRLTHGATAGCRYSRVALCHGQQASTCVTPNSHGQFSARIMPRAAKERPSTAALHAAPRLPLA